MQTLQQTVIPPNSGRAFTMRQGQHIRVTGTTIADFVAFNLSDMREKLDQARTKVYNRTIFVSTGHALMTKANRPILTIVQDQYARGTHDLQHGTCSRSRFELAAREGRLAQYYHREVPPEEVPDHGCWENLSQALEPWGIDPYDIPSPLNLFQTVRVDGETGRMTNVAVRPAPGTSVDMRADMDCLVGISACPDLWAGGKSLEVTVYAG